VSSSLALPGLGIGEPFAHGTKSSASGMTDMFLVPPAINTIPLGSKVAVWNSRVEQRCHDRFDDIDDGLNDRGRR
jgi:hypothetical protein